MESFNARVVSVTDGDTVRVQRESSSEEIRIRFGGIDTPETNQRHGREATQALKRLVLDKDVRVEVTGKRSGARMIGEIFVPASGATPEVDVSLELVKAGHAWFFWQFANENLSRAKILAEAELEAKFNRRGLFAARDPIYPRIFRSGGRILNEVISPEPEIIDNEVRILELVPNPSGQDEGEEKFVWRQSGGNSGGGKPSSEDRHEEEKIFQWKSPFKCSKTLSLRTKLENQTGSKNVGEFCNFL